MEIYWCVYSINRKFERKWLHRNAGKKRNKWKRQIKRERKGWCHLQNDSIVFALRLWLLFLYASMHYRSFPTFLPSPSHPFPQFFSSLSCLSFPSPPPLLFSLFVCHLGVFLFTPLHMWLLCFLSVFNDFFPKHTHLCLILFCIITYFFLSFLFWCCCLDVLLFLSCCTHTYSQLYVVWQC